jgi:hypothetical protein
MTRAAARSSTVASDARAPVIRAMSYGLRIARWITGTPVSASDETNVRCEDLADTLYVATITASLPFAAATAASIFSCVGSGRLPVLVDSAVAVNPSSLRALARTVVGGPPVPDGAAGSTPTTSRFRCFRRFSGSRRPVFTSRVVVRSETRSAAARCGLIPTVRSTPLWVTYGSRNRPRRVLSSRMRRIDSSIRFSSISPSRTAFRTAFQAMDRTGGLSSWSTPALSASTGTRSSPYFCRTPAMPSESVTTTPS